MEDRNILLFLQVNTMSMKLFGKDDCDQFGKVKSEYPVWYYSVHIDDLEESVASDKRRLNRGEVLASTAATFKADLARKEQKLNDIKSNTPTLSVKERDLLNKLRKELEPKIADSLFSRSDMMKGLADGHEEARRMVKNIIPVEPDLAKFLGFCNCNVVKGKASRNALAKAFKLTGKLLGESTNIEILRKD